MFDRVATVFDLINEALRLPGPVFAAVAVFFFALVAVSAMLGIMAGKGYLPAWLTALAVASACASGAVYVTEAIVKMLQKLFAV